MKGTDAVGTRARWRATIVNARSQRGLHNIEHEISFKSNGRFVFHDSCGFEAGSIDELRKVQSFIEERANKERLDDHLHAIWLICMLHCSGMHLNTV